MVDMPEGIGYGEMYEEPGEPFMDRQRRRGRRRPLSFDDLTETQEYRDASPELQARLAALLGGAIGGAAGDAAGPMQAQARAMEGGVMRQEDEDRMRQLQAQQMQRMQPPPGFGGDFIAGEPVIGGSGGGGLTGQMQPMPQSFSQGGPTGQIQELRGQETLGRHVPDMRAFVEEAQRQRMQQQGVPSEQQMQQMQQVQPYSPQDPDIRALGVDPNKRRGLQRQAPIIGNEPVMGY